MIISKLIFKFLKLNISVILAVWWVSLTSTCVSSRNLLKELLLLISSTCEVLITTTVGLTLGVTYSGDPGVSAETDVSRNGPNEVAFKSVVW